MIKWQLTDDLSKAFGPTVVSLDVSKPKQYARPVITAAEDFQIRIVREALKYGCGMFGHSLNSSPTAAELNAAIYSSKELSEYTIELIEGGEIVSADAAIASAEVAAIERAGGHH